MIVGGDLNGHVGISREAIERIHGGWRVGEKDEEGERVTDFAMACTTLPHIDGIGGMPYLVTMVTNMQMR